jgi:hypothetical protein
MEHPPGLTNAERDAHMRAHGLHCYRESFLWGKTPAYRNAAGTCVRFWDRGDIVTPMEMLSRLLDEWRPAGRAECDYAAGRLRHELEALAATEQPHA